MWLSSEAPAPQITFALTASSSQCSTSACHIEITNTTRSTFQTHLNFQLKCVSSISTTACHIKITNTTISTFQTHHLNFQLKCLQYKQFDFTFQFVISSESLALSVHLSHKLHSPLITLIQFSNKLNDLTFQFITTSESLTLSACLSYKLHFPLITPLQFST